MRRYIGFAVVFSIFLLSCSSWAQQSVATPNRAVAQAPDQEPPVAGFIWNYNQFRQQQPNASFNVDGNGSVGGTYQLNGTTVLGAEPAKGNLLVGLGAGNSKLTGSHNTFSGFQAGFANTDGGADNTFYGFQAGYNNLGDNQLHGSDNTFAGSKAGFSNTQGNGNTFVGSGAGKRNTLGAGNTFVGEVAGEDSVEAQEDTFMGYFAGASNISGDRNTFLGSRAGANNATGKYNTFLGAVTGFYNTSGSSNIYIANVGPEAGTESNTIRIGDPNTSDDNYQTAAYIAGIYGSTSSSGVPVYVNADGLLGTQPSSLRFKEQVRDMGGSTSALLKLRPVTFLYKPEYDKGPRIPQYGLIAEEVAQVYPELVVNDKDGQPYAVRYQYLATMLLNEVQKQYQRENVQAGLIQRQEKRIEELEQRLVRLEAAANTSFRTAGQ